MHASLLLVAPVGAQDTHTERRKLWSPLQPAASSTCGGPNIFSAFTSIAAHLEEPVHIRTPTGIAHGLIDKCSRGRRRGTTA